MTSKKWCIMFLASVILVVIMYAMFNMLVDPFGVFGDRIFNWYSYNMTNNPRVAKIAYLDEHYNEYDSYIIGCSSTSSFPTEDLNKYFDAKFYNLIMYGADMLDVEKTSEYIIDNYNVKNLILNVYITNGYKYDEEEDNLTRNLHAKVGGENPITFYGRYAFLDMQYSLAKIKAKREDTYLTKPSDVFDVTSGAYDKKVRDVEPIGNLEKYLESYPIFKNYPQERIELTAIDKTTESIRKIKQKCDEHGFNLIVITSPVYEKYLEYFPKDDVKEFYTKLAEVTPFWDFTTSVVSSEPRYFYDETHFRNAVGTMMIGKIAGSNGVYIPENFGTYVTSKNVSEHVETLWTIEKKEEYTKQVPIIMYHNIKENPIEDSEISPKRFEEQIKKLKDEGYTAVLMQDLVDYVEKGRELPEKPICITFDDGYLSNYEIAYPILKKYNMKATIFVIGSTVGCQTNYKNTEHPITPHFTLEQAKEMVESGVISIQSHTYDMHQWAPYEDVEKARENILCFEDETESEYMKVLEEDNEEIKEIVKQSGDELIAVAYPSGKHETLTNVVLRKAGIKATVTIEKANNTIVRGLPQSLYALNRFNMYEKLTADEMIKLIEGD